MELPSRMKTIALVGGAACSILGGVVIWKDAVAGQKVDHIKSEKQLKEAVSGKVFVVTGANSGIGREMVRELAKRKGKVYMACRDLSKCEPVREEIVLESRNKFVYCRKCDLASFSSVREFAKNLLEKEEKIDVLVNNAGVMNCRKSYTEDGLETQLAVNHMGPFLLTNLLKPALKAACSSRVLYLMNLDYRKGKIDFSDLNSEKNYDANQAFNQSQLANMLVVDQLATQWKEDKIKFYAVYPGVCSTNIKRHMGVDKSITGNVIANPLLWFLTKSAERGAQTPLYVATETKLEEGSLYSNMKPLEVDAAAMDKDLAKKIMAVSMYWTGLAEKSQLLRSQS